MDKEAYVGRLAKDLAHSWFSVNGCAVVTKAVCRTSVLLLLET